MAVTPVKTVKMVVELVVVVEEQVIVVAVEQVVVVEKVVETVVVEKEVVEVEEPEQV
jgi:hypothetical protein